MDILKLSHCYMLHKIFEPISFFFFFCNLFTLVRIHWLLLELSSASYHDIYGLVMKHLGTITTAGKSYTHFIYKITCILNNTKDPFKKNSIWSVGMYVRHSWRPVWFRKWNQVKSVKTLPLSTVVSSSLDFSANRLSSTITF